MHSGNDILTPRLKLRQWKEADIEPFARMSADPRVMAYFPNLLNRQQSESLAHQLASHIANNGWGVWVIEALGTGRFVGITGLNTVGDGMPCGPAVEALWRVDPAFWRLGYGHEAASAAIDTGFNHLALDKIVAFTHIHNAPSIGMMHKLDMQQAEDFEHPGLPETHRLRPHVLFRLSKAQWQQNTAVASINANSAR